METFKIECNWAWVEVTKFDEDIDKEEPIYMEITSAGEKGFVQLTPQDAINLGSHLINLGRKRMEKES